MFKIPVSFLVDTGAGVSLLWGDVWNRAVSGNTKMELRGTHKLVGVDGIPINVWGTVSAKVSLETLTFKQQFAIADGITAEAILGMDFLELDLRSGYWQVEVDPGDQEKTAFCTPVGLLEFNVMPFGLCNALAIFQRLMDSVLAGLHWTDCLLYIDDIVANCWKVIWRTSAQSATGTRTSYTSRTKVTAPQV